MEDKESKLEGGRRYREREKKSTIQYADGDPQKDLPRDHDIQGASEQVTK